MNFQQHLVRLAEIATFTPSDNLANIIIKILRQENDTYHSCWDWDGLVICDKDKEYDCCICFT